MIGVLRALIGGWASGPLGIFALTFAVACIVIAIILSIRNHRNHF